ncbi:MAG: thioredoxin domain-containing protein [Microthrixaceae bacterium]
MNRLGDQASPYLRAHADNPVDWFPWGDEAFDEARRRGVPILLSVGYSACHWCHVMAHESFEDPDVAALMNAGFVNVKVDREERPDVDGIYMQATQAMTGHGGWPMTVFMDHDGRPFYCGTYFPPTRRANMVGFTDVLAAIGDIWTNRRDDVDEVAGQVTEVLRRPPTLAAAADPPALLLDSATASLVETADDHAGGFGTAPKFPHSMAVDFLLMRSLRGGGHEARTAALHALDAMAAGGIHDHVGGGFARYSTDEAWLVPHFEKMLYDNALLLRPYLHAWQITGAEPYLIAVRRTVTYLLEDLRIDGAGFAAAEDADSLDTDGNSVEGAFYLWSADEVREALPAQPLDDDTDGGPLASAEEFMAAYGVSEHGNFEGRNIVFRPLGAFGHAADDDQARRLDRALEALRGIRTRRPRPNLDDKVLTEWNALCLASLAETASVLRARTAELDPATVVLATDCEHAAGRSPSSSWTPFVDPTDAGSVVGNATSAPSTSPTPPTTRRCSTRSYGSTS